MSHNIFRHVTKMSADFISQTTPNEVFYLKGKNMCLEANRFLLVLQKDRMVLSIRCAEKPGFSPRVAPVETGCQVLKEMAV